ncbi:MAG: oligosaccharide flippase family protein [Polaribacter sp.]
MFKTLLKEKNTSKVYQNYFYLLLIQGTNLVLPLITFPYLVRVLGSEKYGLVMIAYSLMKFFIITVDFGFNISATREVSLLRNDKHKLSKFYWNVVIVKAILLILNFLILLVLTLSVEKLKLDPLIYLLSFGLVFGQSIFPTWFFQGIEKMQVITIINVIAKVFFTITIFFIVLGPQDYYYVPVLNGIGFVLAGLLGFVYSLRYVKLVFPTINEIKNNVYKTFSLFVSNLAVSLYTSTNTLILGFFIGDSIAGVYASMEKLIQAIQTMYTPVYQALFPNLSTKPAKGIRNTISKMKIPIAFSGLVISGVIFLGSETILRIIFNDELITRYYRVFQLIGLMAFFSSLNMLYVTLYFPAIKKYNIRMKILVSGGFFNLILALSLVKCFSIYGVASSAILTELFILLIAIYFYKRLINERV